jgi:hypothetical protein
MKNEVRPITITALDHCSVRVASWTGRAMAVEKIMMAVLIEIRDKVLI